MSIHYDQSRPVLAVKRQIMSIQRISIADDVRRAAYALAERYQGELSAAVMVRAAAILVPQGVSSTNLRYEGRLTTELRLAAVAQAQQEVM